MNLNKLARFMRNTGPARFLVPFGLMLLIFGIVLLGFKTDKYVESVGKVTAVTEGIYDSENNEQQYDVEFTYNVDGKGYSGSFVNAGSNYAVGDDIKVFYDPDDPSKASSSKAGGFLAPIMIALGALAIGFGIFSTVKAFKKSKELDEAVPGGGRIGAEQFDGFKAAPGVTEYYFRYDGRGLKPGYLIEDGARNAVFEGKMLKQTFGGTRTYEFTDHTTGRSQEHQRGPIITQRYNNELFSAKSYFKFDGENIWDVIHGRGVRIATDIHSRIPYLIYNITRDGAPFARVESTGLHVHEEDAAQHKFDLPTGGMFYRVWTNSNDMETLFLTIFAISETDQLVVE